MSKLPLTFEIHRFAVQDNVLAISYTELFDVLLMFKWQSVAVNNLFSSVHLELPLTSDSIACIA